MSEDKDYISKQELFMLDLLSNYQWDRPINLLSMGGDLNMGIKEYLMFDGFSYRFVPIRNKTKLSTPDFVDVEDLYHKMTQVYTFDAVSRDDYFIDYQNMYTHLGVLSLRSLFVNCSNVFMKEGQNDRALEMLEMCEKVMADFPLETVPIGMTGNDMMVISMISGYYKLGQPEKARALAASFGADLLKSITFFLEYYDWGKDEFEACGSLLYYLTDALEEGGDKDIASKIKGAFEELVSIAAGEEPEAES